MPQTTLHSFQRISSKNNQPCQVRARENNHNDCDDPFLKMGIISAYIVNKAGGLIYSHDQPSNSAEVEVTFDYPLSIVLEEVDRNLVVKFAEKHGIQGQRSLRWVELCNFLFLYSWLLDNRHQRTASEQ